METTDLTIEDFEYIPGDSLSDRKLLTHDELMTEWDIIHPLPNGKSWNNITCIDGDKRLREAKERELEWKIRVLEMPNVNQNRLPEHWDIAKTVAAHKAGIGYIPSHRYSE